MRQDPEPVSVSEPVLEPGSGCEEEGEEGEEGEEEEDLDDLSDSVLQPIDTQSEECMAMFRTVARGTYEEGIAMIEPLLQDPNLLSDNGLTLWEAT